MRLLPILLLLLATEAHAQSQVLPEQHPNTSNQEVTAVAGTASVTISAVSGKRAHLSGLTARCSAGTASVNVTDGGVTIWSSDAAFIGTTSKSVAWTPKPLASGVNSALVVNLTTCGGGNTGTLDVEVEQYQ